MEELKEINSSVDGLQDTTYAKEVQNLYGFDPSSITKCCRGKQNYTYKHPQTGEALHWLYAEDAIEKGYITQEELDRYINSLKGKGD